MARALWPSVSTGRREGVHWTLDTLGGSGGATCLRTDLPHKLAHLRSRTKRSSLTQANCWQYRTGSRPNVMLIERLCLVCESTINYHNKKGGLSLLRLPSLFCSVLFCSGLFCLLVAYSTTTTTTRGAQERMKNWCSCKVCLCWLPQNRRIVLLSGRTCCKQLARKG